MKYLWKGVAITAMWALVGAIAFELENPSGKLIIGLAILAFFGTWKVAYADFSKCKCTDCKHGEDGGD